MNEYKSGVVTRGVQFCHGTNLSDFSFASIQVSRDVGRSRREQGKAYSKIKKHENEELLRVFYQGTSEASDLAREANPLEPGQVLDQTRIIVVNCPTREEDGRYVQHLEDVVLKDIKISAR